LRFLNFFSKFCLGLVKALLRFYQRFLSVFSYGCCRYYPTCSQYALENFDKNSFFKASYFTITRILRCNQLFAGGIDYPLVNLDTKNVLYKKIDVKYWYVKSKKNKYLLIKNKDWNIKYE